MNAIRDHDGSLACVGGPLLAFWTFFHAYGVMLAGKLRKLVEKKYGQCTVDPDNVAETLCTGKVNVTLQGPLAIITFTHDRAKVGPQMNDGRLEIESVVRARIVTTLHNAIALRDLLNRIIVDMESKSAAPITCGGNGRPN